MNTGWTTRVCHYRAGYYMLYTHTHTRLMALCPGPPGWARTRKVKTIWILLKQETVSGSGISWAICKSAPSSRQITTPAPHRSVFYRPDALPAAQPTVSKHWRHIITCSIKQITLLDCLYIALCMKTASWISTKITKILLACLQEHTHTPV